MVTKADVFKPKVLGGFLQRGRRRPKKRPKPQKPPLTITQILAWADAHFERTGKWPKRTCGPVYDAPYESWSAIHCALQRGSRGLPRGSSLAQLLAERRGVRNSKALPRLSAKQILAWADAHFERTGKWPKQESGRVYDAPHETWLGINGALIQAGRGLPGGSSLAQLLAARRGMRNKGAVPRLSIKQIVAWADAHHQRTGKWPRRSPGKYLNRRLIHGWLWMLRLRSGRRGLPGRTSLARLLAEQRGVRNLHGLPPLSVEQLLAWADAHHARTGKWPLSTSGRIHGAPLGETWGGVQAALTGGRRGLSERTTLARLLAKHRGVRSCFKRPKVTIEQILAWANAHYECTGNWPKASSGTVRGHSHEDWMAVNSALKCGYRGLRGGRTLAQILMKCRGVRCQPRVPKLTIRQILAWADAHHARTGAWPKCRSEPVEGSGGENWLNIGNYLRLGLRGLPGGSSLPELLYRYRRVPQQRNRPWLTIQMIIKWADAHYRRTGQWPTCNSGPIPGPRGESWRSIERALADGKRGLPGGQTLCRLLAKCHGDESDQRWQQD